MYETRPNMRTLRNWTVEKAMGCRAREPHKELFGDFKFKATTTAERIADKLANNLGIEMPKMYRQANNKETASPRSPTIP